MSTSTVHLPRRPRASRIGVRAACLSLALLWAAGGVRAEEAGFGGAPVEERPRTGAALPDEGDSAGESECVVQDESGTWVPCELILEAASERAPPERPAPVPPAAPDLAPAAKKPEPERPVRLSPLEKALQESRKGLETPPLVELRDEVEALRKTIDELYRDPDRTEERFAKQKELAFLDEVLLHVEEKALARMRQCLRTRGLPVPKPPKTYRMTPAGPVQLTAAELKAAGPVIDTYPCERVRVVEQDLIDKVRRYHELRRLLEEDDFGWQRRDEKAALQKELAALHDEIDGDDPLRRYRPRRR